jgi:protein TonB
LAEARRQVYLFPIVLFGSLGIHALAFLFIRFHFTLGANETALFETDPFSLINMEILPPPPAPLLRPVMKTVPQPARAEAPAPVETPDLLAENYVPVETLPEEAAEAPAPAETAAETEAPAGTPVQVRRSAGTGSSAAADYLRRNYDYIQRHILDVLRYPSQARREGIQGAVQVAFTIHTDGSVSGLELRKSSGYEVLDQAALEAVRKAAPFRKPPAEARVVLPISFRLK